jgi:hypothetical protein
MSARAGAMSGYKLRMDRAMDPASDLPLRDPALESARLFTPGVGSLAPVREGVERSLQSVEGALGLLEAQIEAYERPGRPRSQGLSRPPHAEVRE